MTTLTLAVCRKYVTIFFAKEIDDDSLSRFLAQITNKRIKFNKLDEYEIHAARLLGNYIFYGIRQNSRV